MPIFKLLRIHQWIKNFLVFIPLIFIYSISPNLITKIFGFDEALQLAVVFIQFCTISSAVYIFNDIKDVESDRIHPTKKLRPLAANNIKIKSAFIIFCCLLLSTAFLPKLVLTNYHNYDNNIFLILTTYFVINIFYTFYLKKIPLIDLSCIAFGLVLRVLAGFFAILPEAFFSRFSLLFISIFFAAICGGLLKRLIELNHSPSSRKSLAFFSKKSLSNFYLSSALLSLSCFSFFIFNEFSLNSLKTASIIPIGALFYLLFREAVNGKGEDLALHLIKNPLYPLIGSFIIGLLTINFF